MTIRRRSGGNPGTPGREAEEVPGSGSEQPAGDASVSVSVDRRRGVFMISVAAELAAMHPQTLRMYEARGLITPKRSPKNTRLYSYEDVERLRRIQQMTAVEGLNLAGVVSVMSLELELERARSELARMRERATELERQMAAELERVRTTLRTEIVPYGVYEVFGHQTAPGREAEEAGGGYSIPIERGEKKAGETDAG
jgi:MerR family transcriptional regulator/heat shock protein HspR